MGTDYELFCEYKKTKDKKIRDELADRYMYMAKILAHKYDSCGVEFEDIYQVACMGIVLAIDRFDPDRGVQFATFATPTILGEIRRFLRDKARCIKVPRRLYEVFCKAESIKKQSESVTEEELAKLLNMPEKTIREAYKTGDTAFIKSLEDEAYTDGGLSVQNMVGCDEEGFTLVENRDFMRYFKSQLNDREKEVLKYRFYNGNSQAEAAKKMGVSQMYVSRTERKLTDKFKDIYLNGFENT